MYNIGDVTRAIDPRTYFKLPEELQYKDPIPYKKYQHHILISASAIVGNYAINSIKFFSEPLKVALSAVLLVGSIFYIAYSNVKTFIQNRKISALNKEVEAHNKAVKERRKSKLTMAKHYAKGVAKLAAFIVGTAAVTHLVGVSLLYLGEKLNTIDPLKKIATGILNSGHACKWVAKKMFLSVSVPTYALAYELPKFLIKNVPVWIQKIGTWISTNLEKVATYLSNKFFEFIEFIKPHLQKILNVIKKPLIWIGENVVYPLLKHCWKAISFAANKIYDYVLDPIGKILQNLLDITQQAFFWLGNKVIMPILKHCWKAITFVSRALYNSILVPIANKIIDSVSWILKELVIKPFTWTISILASVTTQVYNNVVAPAFKAIGSFFGYILSETYEFMVYIKNLVFSPVVSASYNAASELYASTWSAVKYIFRTA